MSLQYLRKEIKNEVDILHGGKHQSFLQVDFNTFGIKVSYRVILSLFKELQNDKQTFFCVCHKNRWKHSQNFKLLFFTINMHFVTSNQVPTYRKLASHKQYIFSLLTSRNARKTQKTKVCNTFFYFVWKETTHKPLKVEAAKMLFSYVFYFMW